MIGVSKRESLTIIRCPWGTGNITWYGVRDLLFSAVKAIIFQAETHSSPY
jgi:hypothetical protein